MWEGQVARPAGNCPFIGVNVGAVIPIQAMQSQAQSNCQDNDEDSGDRNGPPFLF